jgi:hypothetical protein
MTLEPHPLQPGWRSLDSESFGYRAEDTIEAIALHGLTTFCRFHPLELATHPIGLFPAAATSETPVVIALTVLLLWLVVVPRSWRLRAVGCLLLLLWSDLPSPLLLLRSSTLSVGHNPEVLRLC